jgi:hypothetical protein
MTIRNVTIGDQFITPGKAKRVETVVSFIERKNLQTGEIIGHECWASHEFMGQEISREVPFVHVQRYRIAPKTS